MQDSIEDYIRISRNIKEGTAPVRKETLINAQIKKECDAKAMQIIQFAIEGKMRPDALFKCLPFINQEHYQDIVEERAISKLCGYTLCSKPILDMPKKQFYISTRSNKVYDITERKNYCSNYCYKASLHIKAQIDTSPLWLRTHNEKLHFTLLNKSERALPGEVVVEQVIRKTVLEPFFTSVSDFAHISLDEAEELELNPQEEMKKKIKKPRKFQKKTMKTINENEEEDQIDQTCNKNSASIKKHSSSNDESRTESDTKSNEKTDSIKTTNTNNKTDPDKKIELTKKPSCMEIRKPTPTDNKVEQIKVEAHIKKCFKDWFTLETLIFVHGEDKVKHILDADTLSDYFDALHVADLQVDQQKRYMDICKKLQLKELADEKFDSDVIGNKLRPIPDYQQLKETGKELDLKVKAFYSGGIQIQETKTQRNSIKEEGEEEGSPAVLPLADLGSQTALRRRIFLNSLNKTIQSLFQTLRLDTSLIQSDLQALVRTFKLKADNIVFKPVVWSYVAVILIKILCLKDEHLRGLLERNESKKQLSAWLAALPHKDGIVSDVLQQLSDTDTFVRDYITCK